MKRRVLECIIPEKGSDRMETQISGDNNLTHIDMELLLIQLYSHCAIIEHQLGITKERSSYLKSVALSMGK